MTREDHSPHDADKIKHGRTRQAAVAGQFYPADSEELKAQIGALLALAPEREGPANPRGIIVPHAAYAYSAEVAAAAYRTLRGREFGTAVVICNSHSDYFPGIAIDDARAWQTPLGLVETDGVLAEKLANSSRMIGYNGEVHSSDHTLEVQLPFLQAALKQGFKLLPIVFGNADNDIHGRLASALDEHLGPDDLLVVSTDLSHYPSAEIAREIDEKTLDLIMAGDIGALDSHIKKTLERRLPQEQTLACGLDGIKVLMAVAAKRNWQDVRVLKYMNSGEVPGGDRTRTVGYGALVFGQAGKPEKRQKSALAPALGPEQKSALLAIAREAVEEYAREGRIKDFTVEDERLSAKEGAFVTLKIDGRLRGCIGRIRPGSEPLWAVVRDMAIAAAFEDPRFPALNMSELSRVEYEISVLSAPRKLDSWQEIELGRDGVIVNSGAKSGVFLPQVAAEAGWGLEEFLAHLCADKAGLRPDAYKNDPNIDILAFRAQIF